jgi:hypothetical protein
LKDARHSLDKRATVHVPSKANLKKLGTVVLAFRDLLFRVHRKSVDEKSLLRQGPNFGG